MFPVAEVLTESNDRLQWVVSVDEELPGLVRQVDAEQRHLEADGVLCDCRLTSRRPVFGKLVKGITNRMLGQRIILGGGS